MRKLNGVERKHVRAMAGSLLFGGEHKDNAVSEVAGWLISRGWPTRTAIVRAKEVVNATDPEPPKEGR